MTENAAGGGATLLAIFSGRSLAVSAFAATRPTSPTVNSRWRQTDWSYWYGKPRWTRCAIAFAAGVVSIATYGRSDLLILGLLALSGAQLALWAFLRRDVLTHPVLPTDIAFWFDRATTSAALAGGLVTVVLAVQALLRRPNAAAA